MTSVGRRTSSPCATCPTRTTPSSRCVGKRPFVADRVEVSREERCQRDQNCSRVQEQCVEEPPFRVDRGADGGEKQRSKTVVSVFREEILIHVSEVEDPFLWEGSLDV